MICLLVYALEVCLVMVVWLLLLTLLLDYIVSSQGFRPGHGIRSIDF